jgi:hypothetical protein
VLPRVGSNLAAAVGPPGIMPAQPARQAAAASKASVDRTFMRMSPKRAKR